MLLKLLLFFSIVRESIAYSGPQYSPAVTQLLEVINY